MFAIWSSGQVFFVTARGWAAEHQEIYNPHMSNCTCSAYIYIFANVFDVSTRLYAAWLHYIFSWPFPYQFQIPEQNETCLDF